MPAPEPVLAQTQCYRGHGQIPGKKLRSPPSRRKKTGAPRSRRLRSSVLKEQLPGPTVGQTVSPCRASRSRSATASVLGSSVQSIEVMSDCEKPSSENKTPSFEVPVKSGNVILPTTSVVSVLMIVSTIAAEPSDGARAPKPTNSAASRLTTGIVGDSPKTSVRRVDAGSRPPQRVCGLAGLATIVEAVTPNCSRHVRPRLRRNRFSSSARQNIGYWVLTKKAPRREGRRGANERLWLGGLGSAPVPTSTARRTICSVRDKFSLSSQTGRSWLDSLQIRHVPDTTRHTLLQSDGEPIGPTAASRRASNLSIRLRSISTISNRHPSYLKCSPTSGRCPSWARANPAIV